MTPVTDEYLEALQVALKTEQDGHGFYTDAAAKSGSSLAKATFEGLASAELTHIETIRQYDTALRQDADWAQGDRSSSEDVDLPARIATIFSEAAQRVDETVAAAADDTAAYNEAMEFEKRSYELYRDTAATAGDESSRDFCEFMMREEDEHFRILEETLQYLNNPADWFAKYELPFYEGG